LTVEYIFRLIKIRFTNNCTKKGGGWRPEGSSENAAGGGRRNLQLSWRRGGGKEKNKNPKWKLL